MKGSGELHRRMYISSTTTIAGCAKILSYHAFISQTAWEIKMALASCQEVQLSTAKDIISTDKSTGPIFLRTSKSSAELVVFTLKSLFAET